MTLWWPRKLLAPKQFAIDLAPRSLAGASSVSGFSQVVSSDAGIWKASLADVVIESRMKIACFRALGALLDGRLTPIMVPLFGDYSPLPDDAIGAGIDDDVPHGDGSFFSDETGYEDSIIDIRVTADAPARAVSINVELIAAGDLVGGEHFSIGERLYRVRTVIYSGENAATITFRPPLREAVETGARLEFDKPACRMRLATDAEMDLEIVLERIGWQTVNFIEDI